MGVRRSHLTKPKNAATFSGIRCSKGHDGTRYLATGQCVTCVEIYPTYGDKSKLKRIAADGVMSTIACGVLELLQNHRCAYCGADDPLEMDHKVSLERGGTHWPSNRQGLCSRCNRRKWCHSDGDYRKANGIPKVTRWDAPAHLLQLLDRDVRLMERSPLRNRYARSMDPKGALEALILVSRRPNSPLGRRRPADTTGRGRPRKPHWTPELLLAYACLI